MQSLAQKYQRSLKELFNVSQVELASAEADLLQVTTLPADGTKCARCWNYSTRVGESQQWPTVCERCVAALEAIGVAGTVQ
jgi:isoleucyl-tRNA synthetase